MAQSQKDSLPYDLRAFPPPGVKPKHMCNPAFIILFKTTTEVKGKKDKTRKHHTHSHLPERCVKGCVHVSMHPMFLSPWQGRQKTQKGLLREPPRLAIFKCF